MITDLPGLGCCSVARVAATTEKVLVVGIPFCRDCATELGRVSVMASTTLSRVLGRPLDRAASADGHA